MNSDDATLVARCLRGDASAWTLLVRRYQRLVFAIVRRAGLDEHAAGDVFQTVFARLVESLPRINEPSRLQAWIVTTAKREALVQVGRARRMVSMTSADDAPDATAEWDIPDPAPLPDEALEELQQLDRVRTGLESLDERCRRLLRRLFHEEAIGYDAIARELGIPVGSIGPTRARCLDKLRRLVS